HAQAGAGLGSAEELTAVIGRFLAATGAGARFPTVVPTSRVRRRSGLAAGLLALPVLVTVAAFAIAAGGTLGVPALVLFWLATAAKLANVAFGFSLSQTSHNVMYQALEGRARERVQTIAEGIVQPVAIGVAGGSLLLLTAVAGLGSVGLAWVLPPIAAAWVVLAARVAAAYRGVLTTTLRRRRWGENVLAPLDAEALSLLRASRRDERPGPVLYALGRLAPTDPALTADVWRQVLGHPAEAVRAAALTRLAAAGARGAALLEERLASEPALPVRAGLLGPLAGVGPVGAVEAAEHSLDERHREVAEAAIVVLPRHGDRPRAGRAAAARARLAAAESAADRALAARVIRGVGLGGEHGPGRQRALEGLL